MEQQDSSKNIEKVDEDNMGLFDQQQAGQSDVGVYDENSINTLEWNVHIRRRPGMYIGKLGDGSHPEDGIYVLVKEVVDNSVDEYNAGTGRQIDLSIEEGMVSVRDYGRGIPLGKVVDVTSKINTGAKFDSETFQKSVGLNGVGIKAVNALSSEFEVISYREGKCVRVLYERGELVYAGDQEDTREPNGTFVRFKPDRELFRDYTYHWDTIETMVKNYTYLNSGLAIYLNGKRYVSRHGLLDLLKDNLTAEPLYPIIHLQGHDIEIVLTHTEQYGEEYYSFVNGQHTTQGGTHLTAFREWVSRTIKEYFGKSFEYSDIRGGIVGAVSIRIQEPVFESQTKTKLGSKEIAPDSAVTVNKFRGDFVKKDLDDYLHKNLDTADVMLHKIQRTEKERKALSGITKLARERSKKVSLHNKKLTDCSVHYNDNVRQGSKAPDYRDESSIFITEGLSATGTITKARNAMTQAVFSLRGKPLNSYGLTQKVVYENEEFNLLQAALNIEDSIDGLRYNKVIIATDADVDGMHIRLLIITFFLQFFPDLIKKGHVYILQTPLFRVRNKKLSRRRSTKRNPGKKVSGESVQTEKDTIYCYSEEERLAAIEHFGANAEITRFKGLGEINVEEFQEFIGDNMRLDPVVLRKEDSVDKLLEFYMGKNTMNRQNFIIDNLVIEDDSQIS